MCEKLLLCVNKYIHVDGNTFACSEIRVVCRSTFMCAKVRIRVLKYF